MCPVEVTRVLQRGFISDDWDYYIIMPSHKMNMHIRSGFVLLYFIRLCFCLSNQPFPLTTECMPADSIWFPQMWCMDLSLIKKYANEGRLNDECFLPKALIDYITRERVSIENCRSFTPRFRFLFRCVSIVQVKYALNSIQEGLGISFAWSKS